MQFEIGDIVHARDTKDWYGLITNVVGKDSYVQWFEKEYERNGWFIYYLLEKVNFKESLDNLNERG
jgi:hypothetical protein